MMSTGYNTFVALRADGTERREVVHGKNPGRDLNRFIARDIDSYENTTGFYYEFKTYVSIGSPKELVSVHSGVTYVDGRVFSRNRVSKFKDESLKQLLTDMMDHVGLDFVVETKGVWYTFDNTQDRLISVW